MPHHTACLQCQRVGLVRFENVIKGIRTSKLYYCGACDHEWTVEDTPEPTTLLAPPQRRPKTRTLGPKRR